MIPISNDSYEMHDPCDTSVISNEFLVPRENLVPRHPQRSNKGIPKKQYELDPRVNVKYLIRNNVFNHRLFESYALTINQLSIVSIPSSV